MRREYADHETVITWQAPPLRFGEGATDEIGHELNGLGVRSVLLVTDENLVRTGLPGRVAHDLQTQGIKVEIYDRVKVEPTDRSCEKAANEVSGIDPDGYLAIGGGSTIDTAKMLNLLGTYPGTPVREYLNRPVGAGRPIPGPLRPLIAVPTTAGTGSECTQMVALGVEDLHLKTGISDSRLRPAAAIVDPLNTLTLPPAVTAATGYDVLTHACESYTARRYDARPPYASPADRPVYVGGNPISDVWVERSLELVGRYLRRAVCNPYDIEARVGMAQAATFAGMGFGNAGTHIPHACAYPIAGLVSGYRPSGYPVDQVFVPHGQSVVVTAAAAMMFPYHTAPERHLRAAELLGANLAGVTTGNGSDALPQALLDLVDATDGPHGLTDFGYRPADIPSLVEGAMQQQRLLVCCPREVSPEAISRILQASMAP